MRIHSDILTTTHVAEAAHKAGILVQGALPKGSRSRKGALEIAFSGSGRQGGQWGSQPYKAATWDEWGMALAYLFSIDPEATVAGVYADAENFHWRTAHRFESLTPDAQHIQHRWSYVGNFPSSDGILHECKCGATTRR